jgi:hypothetical protein
MDTYSFEAFSFINFQDLLKKLYLVQASKACY